MKSYCKREEKLTTNLSENKYNYQKNELEVVKYNIICKCGYLKTVYEKNGCTLIEPKVEKSKLRNI